MKQGNLFLARRYARAYDGVAACADDARADMRALQNLLAALAPAAGYLNNPVVAQVEKLAFLEQVCAGQSAAENFVKILVAQKRFALAPLIEKELQNLLDARLGVKRALIQTAAIPSPDEAFERDLARLLGGKIAASYENKPALLAGARVRSGDVLIDASALGRVRQLSKILTGK
ncbi:MAG: F0F1 ATP synthase subunit delta [Elusimicrobiota bacterium]|jgi:F-type H+-transporting ATPase subunit delta|nr:F0F1 ATP synthase subunit delta [Elusimicrobiota bacterium]